jgi:uncharacterized protein with HEPN domain
MPLENRTAALLHDMLESARRAIGYAAGRSRKDLDSDPMFADAVERRIEIIGEAARGLSETFRASHPEIPWRAIMATRHILVHDYGEVNPDIVWRIVQDHLPPLVNQLVALLAENPP